MGMKATTPTRSVTLRLPDEMVQEFDKARMPQKRSLNAEVLLRLEKLERYEQTMSQLTPTALDLILQLAGGALQMNNNLSVLSKEFEKLSTR
jgi:hypothetical protein